MAVEAGRPKGYIFALKLTCFSEILGLIWHLLTCNGFDPCPHSWPDSRLPQFYSLLPPHSPREPLAGQADICGCKVLVHFCLHGGLVALPQLLWSRWDLWGIRSLLRDGIHHTPA